MTIENRRPALKLQKRIEDMVDRAAKLHGEPSCAFEIYMQAKEGSVAAQACLTDLEKCFRGRAEIMSIDWDSHNSILNNRAKGETCRDKAAQICLDWLRWRHEVRAPALTLGDWLLDIGNLPLSKKLDYPIAHMFGGWPGRTKEDRRKERAVLRQRKHRLKNKGIGAEDEIGLASGEDFSSKKRDAFPVGASVRGQRRVSKA
jgi:hypothetical protein